MEKKEISEKFYKFIESKKNEIETELNSLHAESRRYRENGHKSSPEMDNEKQLQKKLREAKTILRSCIPVYPSLGNDGVAQVGSYITILFGGVQKTLRLEGVAYFDKEVCSLETDLGKKLLGVKEGESFLFNNSVVNILNVKILNNGR